MPGEPLLDLAFSATLIEWRGPAPFVFAPIPEEHTGEIRFAARAASYGWGVVPVEARIRRTAFSTSLFPRIGVYLLPVKLLVQRSEGLGPGDRIEARIRVIAP